MGAVTDPWEHTPTPLNSIPTSVCSPMLEINQYVRCKLVEYRGGPQYHDHEVQNRKYQSLQKIGCMQFKKGGVASKKMYKKTLFKFNLRWPLCERV